MTRYEKALKLFGIESGFVENQLDALYTKLKEKNNPEAFPFLSPEYMEKSDLCYEITMAYYVLYSYHKNYILGRKPSSNENLEEEILKLIQDNIKSGQGIDENFLASLTEEIVCKLGLHDYVRRIEFQTYDKLCAASYSSEKNILTIYLSSVTDSINKSMDSRFSPLEKEYHPYCYSTTLIRHEIEHANQKKIREQNGDDIETKILLATEAHKTKMEQEIERIIGYPILIYIIAILLKKLKRNRQYKIYRKNWHCAPSERLAEIRALNFSLNLIERLSKELSSPLSILEENLMYDLEDIVIAGYDKHLSPAIFYLERFKQYRDCLDITEMSKGLSLEERLALGLKASPTEIITFDENPKKILQKIRTM